MKTSVLEHLVELVELISAAVLLVGFVKGVWGFLRNEWIFFLRKRERINLLELRPVVGNYILLGLAVGGNSENYGAEQEHLNQVFGAHLLITGLHAREGFGVEFLDYLAPPGGRHYPADRSLALAHQHPRKRYRKGVPASAGSRLRLHLRRRDERLYPHSECD